MQNNNSTPEFLAGGGEMGELIRTFDWSKTPLGPISNWPKSLRTCVQIMLTSRQPIWIGWGEELIKLYNDPYKDIVRGKHPWALGKPASVVWKDIWKDIEPMLEKVMKKNEGTYVEEQLLIMERNGYPEETYYTFSYTPVAGDFGGTAGMICFNTDDTDRIISERQLKTLTDLGKALSDLKTAHQAFEKSILTIAGNKWDFPFAALYELDRDVAKLITSTDGDVFQKRFASVDLKSQEKLSQLFYQASLTRKHQILEEPQAIVGEIPKGGWEIAPKNAVILPVAQGGVKDTYGILFVGLNPYRILDEQYLDFFHLVADQIATSLANISAIEEERKRLEALAEIDRAKTIFFNNISHEFRTPLTLMLGPIQEVLQDSSELKPQHISNLQLSHKNTLRLQKLVNTLLDFSRIESGKLEAKFTKLDIARLTEDLASSFRSAVESAGLKYSIKLENKTQLVTVDPNMWEKIVLNLISNAFKYTDHGSIEVDLSESDDQIHLRVSDTGVGIPAEELPRIFERFYRARSANGRSQEGTGIGLSMVRELVQLLKGEIQVSSVVGKGSVFTVSLPVSTQVELSPANEPERAQADLRSAFIEEAMDWAAPGGLHEPGASPSEQRKSKVLVADDNSDMREYIHRLLKDDFEIIMAADGEDAYRKAVNHLPDLILSDIMMPRLDGFGLLKAIRSSFSTRNIPLIFLSARAGEEAKVEGIEAGADDYLVKPFSSKELLARVANQISISKARRESEKQFFNLFLQSPAHIHVMRGPEHIFEFFHPLGKAFTGGRDFTGMKVREAVPEIAGQGYFEMLDQVYHEGKSFNIPESKAYLKNDQGELTEYYFHITYLPWKDVDGKIIGVLQFSFDVTKQAKARLILEEAEYKLQNAIDLAELGTWHIDLQTNMVLYDQRIAEWWGISAEGSSLETVINCILPEDRDKVRDAVNHALTVSGIYNAEYRLLNRDTGELRYLIAKGKVFHDNDQKPIRLSGIARDITLQKMAQQELERLVTLRTKELQEANVELKRSNEDLQQFAYVASHDLQEPLRKIQTFSELAHLKLEDPNAARLYLNKIDSSAARMASLIKDVLAYSQSGRKDIETEAIDLADILENVKNDFELLIQQKNVSIIMDKMPIVKGSRRQFHQLFSNLIGNSIKFANHDPVIQVSARTVSKVPEKVSVRPASIYHELTIKDNGIGFEPIYSEQIFQLFSRLHNRTDYGGTGIGLSLCKKIVENHHGAITATSEKGKGATFTVYLPAELSNGQNSDFDR